MQNALLTSRRGNLCLCDGRNAEHEFQIRGSRPFARLPDFLLWLVRSNLHTISRISPDGMEMDIGLRVLLTNFSSIYQRPYGEAIPQDNVG